MAGVHPTALPHLQYRCMRWRGWTSATVPWHSCHNSQQKGGFELLWLWWPEAKTSALSILTEESLPRQSKLQAGEGP